MAGEAAEVDEEAAVEAAAGEAVEEAVEAAEEEDREDRWEAAEEEGEQVWLETSRGGKLPPTRRKEKGGPTEGAQGLGRMP